MSLNFLVLLVLACSHQAAGQESVLDRRGSEVEASSEVEVSLLQTVHTGGVVKVAVSAGAADSKLDDVDEGFLLQEDPEDAQPNQQPEIIVTRSTRRKVTPLASPLMRLWTIATSYFAPDLLAFLAAGLGFLACRLVMHCLQGNEKAAGKAPKCQPAAPRKGVLAAEERDDFGCTKLHLAAHAADRTEVRRLLEGGAAINAREAWDETPLHIACREGHLEVVRLLLDGGAASNMVNADDKTPLILAAEAWKEEICELLLERQAGVAGVEDDKLPQLLVALIAKRMGKPGPVQTVLC